MKDIYVDGAGSNQKTLCGGWAYVVYEDGQQVHHDSGGARYTTNNRMELMAVLEAMKYSAGFDNVNIYCDSAYIVNCLKDKWYLNWRKNGWRTAKKTPVLNRELWEEILKLYENYNFNIVKVKGHSDCQGNIMADSLAVQEKKRQEGLLECQELSSLCL